MTTKLDRIQALLPVATLALMLLACAPGIEAAAALPGAGPAAAAALPPLRTTIPAVAAPPVGAARGASGSVLAPAGEVDVSGGLAGPQSEPSVAIDPTDPQQLVAGSNDPATGRMDAYDSSDGGQSWGRTFVPSTDSAGNTGVVASDPVVAADTGGNFYYAYLLLNSNLSGSDLVVAKSADAGQTWNATAATNGFAYGYLDDKPWLAVDNWPSSPNRGNLYLAFTRDQGTNQHILLTVSTNQDATWSTPVQVDSPALHEDRALYAQVAAAPDGSVYVIWDDYSAGTTSVIRGNRCTVSGGTATCGTPFVVGSSNVNLAASGPAGPGTCSGFQVSCYGIPAQPNRGIAAAPTLAVYGSSGSSYGVYAAWDTATAPGAASTQVVFAASSDRGLTWSPPLQLNNDNAQSDYDFFPSLAVDPTNGRIWASFYSTRNDPTNHQQADVYTTSSADGGAQWSPDLRVTAAPSDEGLGATGQIDRNNNYGDYEGLAVYGAIAHPVWTDTYDAASVGEEIFTAAVTLRPVGLVATVTSQTSADLTWQAVTGASSYNVYVSPGTSVSTSVYAAVYSEPTNAAAFPGLREGQPYAFAVDAVTPLGVSAPSATVVATPGVPAPQQFNHGTLGTADVALSWNPAAGATSYNVYVGDPSTVSTSVFTAAFTGISGTTFQATGLTSGTLYGFVVAGVDAVGVGAPAGPLAAATFPVPPTNLTASSRSPDQAELTWTAPPGSDLTYTVVRTFPPFGSLACAGGDDLATVTGTSYLVTNTQSSRQSMYFCVEAIANGLTGDATDYVGIVLAGGPTPPVPAPPTALTARTTYLGNQIELSWTAPAPAPGLGPVAYEISRSQGAGSAFTLVANGMTGTVYVDSGLALGTTYDYQVQALAIGGTSAPSGIAGATTAASQGAAGTPDPPTGLTAAATSAGQIDLGWTAPAGANLSYNVYRSTGGSGGFARLAAGSGQTSYADTTVSPSTTYDYYVTAVSGGLESAPSNTAGATTQAAGSVPAGGAAGAGGGGGGGGAAGGSTGAGPAGSTELTPALVEQAVFGAPGPGGATVSLTLNPDSSGAGTGFIGAQALGILAQSGQGVTFHLGDASFQLNGQDIQPASLAPGQSGASLVFTAALAAAYQAGLVQGVSPRHFAPDRPISREELAALLGRALQLEAKTYVLPAFKAGPLGYTDRAAVDAWARQGVGYAAQLGLLKGMPDGSFAPSATTTRAQAAVTLVRLLRLIGQSPIVGAPPAAS